MDADADLDLLVLLLEDSDLLLLEEPDLLLLARLSDNSDLLLLLEEPDLLPPARLSEDSDLLPILLSIELDFLLGVLSKETDLLVEILRPVCFSVTRGAISSLAGSGVLTLVFKNSLSKSSVSAS